MKYLLDTNAFLQGIGNSTVSSSVAQEIMMSEESIVFLSVASIWEISVKVGIQKLKLPLPLGDFLKSNLRQLKITLLPIRFSYAVASGLLPLHHKDPFDRLIIAQALSEHLPIVSSDANFDRYGIERIW
jgi:PIN domain nuclease of toxin-antitoxin system